MIRPLKLSKTVKGMNTAKRRMKDAPTEKLVFWLAFLSIWTVMYWIPANLSASAIPTSEDHVGHIMRTQEKLSRLNNKIEKETLLAEQSAGHGRHQIIKRLQEIKFVHQRLLFTLKKNITLASEETAAIKKMENGQAYRLEEQKPYSLSYYDKLLDIVAAVQQKKTDIVASIQSAEIKADEYEKNLEAAQRTLRRVKEEVSQDIGKPAASDLRYPLAVLEKEAAEGILELQTAKRSGLEGELRIVELQQKAALEKLVLIKKDLTFDPAAIDLETARLEKQRVSLNTRLQSFLDEQRKVEHQWRADRENATGKVVDAALKSRDAWQKSYESALGQTEDMVHLINTQEKLWKYRYTLVKMKVSDEKREQWEKEAAAVRNHTRQTTGLYHNRQVSVRAQAETLEASLKHVDPLTQKYISLHIKALNRAEDFSDDYFSTLLATGQLAGRLLEEISNGETETLMERVLNSGFKFHEIWNLELWVIDEHGVTVKKVLTALMILIIGIILVKRTIKSLAARLHLAKFEAGAVAGAEKILLYGGFILVVLFALRIVNIPLTAFTFLGGAIAIGFGFGAQNLINNFISGFIIMAERPIRIGDVIELEGKCVRVEEIGARCTKVKTVENIHILVPNSNFLEKNITNWTLSDKMIRTHLSVGVAYGSCVDKVTELLLDATVKTAPILKTPPPFVIFEDFGDSCLIFEIHYWLKVGGMMERNQIAGALRYQINDLFNTHGIVIAFPQQDIHLNAVKPLQIRLTEPMRKASKKSLEKTIRQTRARKSPTHNTPQMDVSQ